MALPRDGEKQLFTGVCEGYLLAAITMQLVIVWFREGGRERRGEGEGEGEGWSGEGIRRESGKRAGRGGEGERERGRREGKRGEGSREYFPPQRHWRHLKSLFLLTSGRKSVITLENGAGGSVGAPACTSTTKVALAVHIMVCSRAL